jgi:hypothetical protein
MGTKMKTVTSIRTRIAMALLALVAGVGIAACDDVLNDPTFRMWCGENLCQWKTEKGRIQKAPTWHRSDFGVELVETPTAISQDVTGRSPGCLEITMVADVDPSAQVTVSVDFNRDGSAEFEAPIAATNWRESKTQVTAPRVYDGLRFTISKKGTGRAVLAQMRVQAKQAHECSAPPVVQKDLPLGTPCFLGDPKACGSGVCCDGLCAECCAVEPKYQQQRDDNSIIMNEDHPCAGGAKCAAREKVQGIRGFFLPAIPRQCDPGKKTRPAGAACLADDDCASNDCSATSTGIGPRANANDPSFESSKPCTASFPDADHCAVFTSVTGGTCR